MSELRLDGPDKVRGTARYAAEHPVEDPVHLYALQSRIARGSVTALDVGAARAQDGVLGLLTHDNAPRLAPEADRDLVVLQSAEIGYRGQFIGAVLAETPEAARHAAGLVQVQYAEQPAELAFAPDDPQLVAPEKVNAGHPTDTDQGDVDAAFAAAEVLVRGTYRTPLEHNNPMEPHATIASWSADGELTLYDSTQGVHWVRDALVRAFGLDPERVHVISPHVGGGFGSKGIPHSNVVLTAMAARLVAPRPVKYPLTRGQMFDVVGYRTPTVQHIRMAADSAGRLTAISHDVAEQSSRTKEFAEQTAVPTRTTYAAPNRRTAHRIAVLDVPVPSWMRAPGECPGMFGLEVAADETAEACGLDPIEFRERNDTAQDPATGLPFSSRNLVSCLRTGAQRFGWYDRAPSPRGNRDGEWLVGTGVAASTYPVLRMPGSRATVRARPDGTYQVLIGASDIGTGAWTALTRIAAEALDVPESSVRVSLGDTDLPWASGAGGSTGTNCWGSAIVHAARLLREQLAEREAMPDEGVAVTAGLPDNPHAGNCAMHAFGAQFAEVRVHVHTGEVRVPRLLGIFAVGRVINAVTGRSQLIGGMTMGLSGALHEHSYRDPRFGHVVNRDLAQYHIAGHADIGEIEADWIEEHDPYVNPMGAKGIGEIGIVGTAAAVANGAYHASGVRVRELPLTPDRFLRGP
ncbi:xanthine dehydrogenase family protein molybdopterin-binding subunit [Saccharopolyspora sp. HNM0983]|uniref:Xanthine dehydrogenase family protein molybdopterin-binding subunit n=1 Tax=Saccharopolyspora montiporae TaxID=2781240 RepID=A0A929G1S8_9PSEU|nr:xanthine dehydrogenase family protein molybdopterin-binding subunit [Saccharopolyspora sp. HNM0983]MBE9376599.1 xanthine dehydrogenase family protein molybdopterin-binding subunit [Saccharopolyspora sp. HNM0983]